MPQRMTYDYVRAGTTTLFAALDVASGKVIGSLCRRHRADEFKKFLITLDRQTPDGLDLHLVLDNYATHKTPAIKTWLLAHPRFLSALHPDRVVLAQSRRAVVRRTDHQADSPRRTQVDSLLGEGHSSLDCSVEHRPQALRVTKTADDPRTSHLISEQDS